MKLYKPAWAASVAALLVAGCSGESERGEPMPVEESVFGEQVEQLERVRGEARKMEDRVEDLNRELGSLEE